MSDVLLDGFHAVKHALRFAPDLVSEVRTSDAAKMRRLAERLAPDLLDVLLARAAAGPVQHHTGVQGLARRPEEDRSVLRARTAPLVLLEAPRHPGNTGAVIRVAAAAAASGVAVTGPLDPWAPAVLRGSAGLHYAVPVLRVAAEQVAGPLVVLSPEGDPDGTVPPDAVLLIGSERTGVSDALRERADRVVALPMRSGVSSLNLATAVAAALYRR